MLVQEKEKLFAYDKKYISIGISEGGMRYDAISVSWERPDLRSYCMGFYDCEKEDGKCSVITFTIFLFIFPLLH